MVEVHVISQTPPGGRCSLYTDYGQALEKHAGAQFQLEISTTRDANGNGFPSIWINGSLMKPEDGVIVMPEEVVAVLAASGMKVSDSLNSALDAAMKKMLGEGE